MTNKLTNHDMKSHGLSSQDHRITTGLNSHRDFLQKLASGSAFCLFSVAMIGAAQAAGPGPSGRYYVTDESGFNKIWQFQGNSLSSFPTAPSGGADGPIVVDGNTNTVRSVKGGFGGGSSPSPGSEYDFSGNVLASLSLDFSSHPGYGRVIDAAFDGTSAYIVSGLFGTSDSGVFRYASDFSGTGTLLFTISGSTELKSQQGITYDTKTKTLWTSDYNVFGGSGIG